MMIANEKRMGCWTEAAAIRIRSTRLPRLPPAEGSGSSKARKIRSTMTIVPSTRIPKSRAAMLKRLSGISLSLLSIAALDFGILVDGTIVMVERILRAFEEPEPSAGGSRGSLVERIRIAAASVQRPILFSFAIIIAAYLPLLTLERVERRLFTPMAITVCYALLGSLILCLTFVPALATYLFQGQTRHRPHRLLDLLTVHYERIVRRI